MPDIKVTSLPKSEVKIEFEVSVEEAKPYLEEAVKDLTTSKPIAGFRPGKATYEDAKRAYGEMRIWESALERLVRAFYVRTILNEGIDTVGSPEVAIDQLTPGQPVKFNIIAPVEPKVKEFPDLKKCEVSVKETKVTDEQVTNALNEMRRMRRTEARVERPATMDDLVMIDLEMKKDHVILEGGTGKDYRVYLNEEHYIPGFTKELIGIAPGEERSFKLSFPKEHFQKHLAGQEVEFTAKTKGVFELAMPEVNDEFAKGVGLESLAQLQEKLRENMALESEHRAKEAAEVEMLEKLVDHSTFSDVPDLLVNEEIRRMIAELEQGVEEQGMSWSDYLSSLKKTADELKLDFVPQAVRRIKTAVLIKQIAKREDIKITDEEIDQEVDRILNNLRPDDKDTRERVASPEYREYVGIQMRNRRALDWLKKECLKEADKK